LTFSKKLRELRKKKRLSQDELVGLISERTGKNFGRSTISNYENDVSAPGLDVIPHLAKILDVSIDELLNENPVSDHQTLIDKSDLDSTYPEYVKQGADKVYEDAINYGYQQDEMIISIREKLEAMEHVASNGNENDTREQLLNAIDLLKDLAHRYHDQTHKLVDAYQRSNRLAELLKAPFKLKNN